MTLFGRKHRVTIDTIEINKLDVEFDIVKTTSKEPNTLEMRIYNLNPEHRAQLAQLYQPIITVEAGYEEDIGQIFKGKVTQIRSSKEGPDWVTEVNTGDGEDELATARINKTFNAGTPFSTVIKKVAAEMKVGIGNAALKALEGDLSGAANEVSNALTVSGRASTELDGLLRSANLEWSVQDQELQLMTLNDMLEGLPVRLAKDSGLIGSPTIGSDGIVEVTALMNWSITPGRKMEIESEEVPKAFYRAQRCEYVGDSAGQDWYVNVEAKAQ